MCEESTKTLDILLFASGNYLWGVDIHFVQLVKWGIRGGDLRRLKEKKRASILGILPEFGVEDAGQLFPAIFLVGTADIVDYESFYGATIFLGHDQKDFAVLANEIIGTEALKITEQIRLLPKHLKTVFSGKNIWAAAEVRENLAYLFEPPSTRG